MISVEIYRVPVNRFAVSGTLCYEYFPIFVNERFNGKMHAYYNWRVEGEDHIYNARDLRKSDQTASLWVLFWTHRS